MTGRKRMNRKISARTAQSTRPASQYPRIVGMINPPRRGQKISAQADDDDHEALRPHADIDQQGDDEQQQRRFGARDWNHERQRNDHVTGDHQPVERRIRAERAVLHQKLLELVAAVPGHENFDGVAEVISRLIPSKNLAMLSR